MGAEADPLLYTTGVHAPVVASTYAHGVVAPAVSSVVATPAVYAAAPAVHHVAAPVVSPVAAPAVYSGVHTAGVYNGLYNGVYNGLSSVYGHYGKREAEAEPYTIGQVYAGLPVANAYATGHAHNVGYTTNLAHGVATPAVHSGVHSGVYSGVTGYPYAHHGYGYN